MQLSALLTRMFRPAGASLNALTPVRMDLFDADGCLYHKLYHDLKIIIGYQYGADADLCCTQLDAVAAGLYDDVSDHELKVSALTEPQKLGATILQYLSDLDINSLDQDMLESCQLNLIIEARKDPENQHFSDKKCLCLQLVKYIECFNRINPLIMQTICELANQNLFNYIMQQLKPGMQHLIGSGSGRMDDEIDIAGMVINATNSFIIDFAHITKIFQRYSASSLPHEFMMADVYGDLPSGTSFKRILNDVADVVHAEHIRDLSKVTYIYASIFDAFEQHGMTHLNAHLFENEMGIINGLFGVYGAFREMLPLNSSLTLHCYNGKLNQFHQPVTIAGMGPADPNYRKNIKFLATLASYAKTDHETQAIDCRSNVDFYEFLAYRHATAGGNILAIMLDADGCFYNFRFNWMLTLLNLNHTAEINRVYEEVFSHNNMENVADLLARLNATLRATNMNLWKNTKDGRPSWVDSVDNVDLYVTAMKISRLSRDFMNELLYAANEQFINAMVNQAAQDQYQAIVIISASNRTSIHIDLKNAMLHGTGLFMEDLHYFTRFLNQRFHDVVRFHYDRFYLADAYNNLPPGTAFQQALKCAPNRFFFGQPHSVFNREKLNVVLGILQHLKSQYKGVQVVEYLDDQELVLTTITQAYQQDEHNYLLPPVLLRSTLYMGDYNERKVISEICGTGKVNHDYYAALKLMVTFAGASLDVLTNQPGKSLNLDFDKHHVLSTLSLHLRTLEERSLQSKMEFEALVDLVEDELHGEQKDASSSQNIMYPVPRSHHPQ